MFARSNAVEGCVADAPHGEHVLYEFGTCPDFIWVRMHGFESHQSRVNRMISSMAYSLFQ
jgi:hypothetical protein